MEPNKISLLNRLTVYLTVVIIAWGFYFAEISPLFSFIGFRIYIPLLPLAYIIYLRFRNGEPFRFRPFPWKTGLVIIAGNLLIAAGGWYFALLKFRLPEFHFELAASSLADFPVYFIWNVPLFFLIWSGLRGEKESAGSILLASLFLLLFFSPQIYHEILSLNKPEEAVPLTGFIAAITVLWIFSKSPIHFALNVFSTAWIIILIYGTDHRLLLNTFLAYRYDAWEGFFKAKSEILNYFRAGGVMFSILMALIAYRRTT